MYVMSTERREGHVRPRCGALGRRRPSPEVTSRRWSSTCPRGACYTTRSPHTHTHIDTHIDAHIDAHAHTHTVHTHTHTHTHWSEHARTHTHTPHTINIQFASTCAVAPSKRVAAPCAQRHGKEAVIVLGLVSRSLLTPCGKLQATAILNPKP
jgi:hypothetical protein